jgi:hypothetical protein
VVSWEQGGSNRVPSDEGEELWHAVAVGGLAAAWWPDHQLSEHHLVFSRLPPGTRGESRWWNLWKPAP